PTTRVRGIAAGERHAQALKPEGRERAKLVLRERRGRVEVEGAVLRVASDSVQHGQVERQRLAAGRAGCNDDVLTAYRGVPRRALVGVELSDPLRREHFAHPRVQLVWERRERGLARRLGAHVRDLLALEEIVP